MILRPPDSRQVLRDDDVVATWLDLFERLLHVPPREARDIRDEIEGHLRERARDLMIEGVDEPEAVRRAVAELGGAADLARSFRFATGGRRRRLTMNAMLLAGAGGALVLSVVAVSRPGGLPSGAPPVRQQVYQPAARAGAESTRVGAPITAEGVRLADVFDMLRDAAKTPIRVRWASLGESGLEPGLSCSVRIPEGPIGSAIEALNDALGAAGHGAGLLDFRADNGVVLIATPAYFDRREAVLAAYNIEPVSANGVDDEALVKVITTFVEPDGWRDNGGNVATMSIVGARLFVHAPPRFHEGVKWFIEQLSPPAPPAAGAPPAQDDDARMSGQVRSRVMIDPPMLQLALEQWEAAPSTLRSLALSHAAADHVAESLQRMLAVIRGAAVSVHADPSKNIVLLRGDKDQVEAAEQIVWKINDLARLVNGGRPAAR